jgi:hypothetical protein
MAGIEPTIGMKHLWAIFFFFLTRENWMVVFASRRNNGNATCHIYKERDSRGCMKRNSSCIKK